ncbi:MAG TPA: SBBP repeat-containing protein, partial [Pyrinomonadaceae bacterium]|nr:SBBP repeat-containing protein [Pyrinomonadaceae bacterium]
LTADEAVYVLPMPENAETKTQNAFALRMKLVGANENSTFAGENVQETKTNYFKGAKEDWRTDIPNFGAVRFENVFDGIGMRWHGLENGAARYDFIVEPNADASQITLDFQGAENVEIDAEGNLLIQTEAGTIKQNKPFTFQENDGIKNEIESSFRIENNRIKFSLGEYDRSKPLTIDPTVTLNNLAFSTFIGSFADEFSNDIAVDSNGHTYITGKTLSTSFPTTAGTFDTTSNGFEDVFVTKFNSSGTGIVFSTYLGGTFYDESYGIEVDATGNIYVTGVASISFPTTSGAFDETFNGGSDVFVTKLNPNGSALLYSTYIGASNSDLANDIAIDSSGNAYIVVRTADTIVDYPTTPGAFDTTFNGNEDVAVTKLNPTGSALIYSTFLGGSNIDVGRSIAVNANGEVFVGGTTTDDVVDFPTTAGSFDTTHNGITDYFATKISADGSSLIFSTFIGGPGIDNANAMTIDSAGNMYLAGVVSAGFPTTAGVFDTTNAGSNEIGVSKLSANGATLVYSTYLGGTQGESANGIAVDQFGNAYVTGSNFGGDFPTTSGAFDTTFNGNNDAILTVLNQNASGLVYSTYLGGGGNDTANRVALDSVGNVYLTGQTVFNASFFPTTSGAYQTFQAGGNDGFVAKFGDYSIGGKVIDTNGNPLSNVLIALSGQVSGTVLTGADGRFGFLDTVPGEPHAVSATRAGYSINPAIFNISTLANNREFIFVGAVGSPTGGSGGTLAFQNLAYNKTENGGNIILTVKRTGTLTDTNPVTVDFQTTNGTAIDGQDFIQTNGVLTFNTLETSKTITIPILNDNTLEPLETFSIELSNPTNNADIETNHGSAQIKILDEDLSNGSLIISEFRERGRLGANDEYIKLFNPNDFDVTIQTADNSNGMTLAKSNGASLTTVATIPNLVTIPSRGHYLLTNNNPNGGFSLINYPTGTGSTTSVGDQTFSADIPDNSNLVLLKTADSNNFNQSNLLDSVSFESSVFSEGKYLSPMTVENSEMSYVRKFTANGLQDLNNNSADFMLVDNHAQTFAGNDQTKILSILGAPAPETSESLRLMKNEQISIEEFGAEIFDSAPVPNGAQGTLTVYRKITNLTNQPILALRLRAFDFATFGSQTQKRFSSRPDFRLISSMDEGANVKGVTLAAENLQPNGGGINSTLTIDSITQNAPLLPNQSVVVAIKFGVMRYGRHPLSLAAEALQ